MKVQDITTYLEKLAPLSLQENYDNAGLLTGNKNWPCTGVLVSLDVTEQVVAEAVRQKCNLIVAHHPIIFTGLKNINGNNYVEKTIIAAIKNDVAIYAIHTNLDNVLHGVNAKIADALGLVNRRVLLPKAGLLKKLFTFVPQAHAKTLRQALFVAGAGHISNYSECSFSTVGEGTFKPEEGSRPVLGQVGKRHNEPEIKIEVIFPAWLEASICAALKAAHPYEEVAYDVVPLSNLHNATGSGLIGELPTEIAENELLKKLKQAFNVQAIRHTELLDRPVKTVAVCGGSGSFLTKTAASAGAQFFVSADFKYHDFFDADEKIVIADIGHYESEQFTIELLSEFLQQKFPTFAVLKTGINTNPIKVFS
jgi:dinuclear metal center YbgI/SA1388 family protein